MRTTPADEALLSLLREDARASTAEIARKLGVSRTTVQTRFTPSGDMPSRSDPTRSPRNVPSSAPQLRTAAAGGGTIGAVG